VNRCRLNVDTLNLIKDTEPEIINRPNKLICVICDIIIMLFLYVEYWSIYVTRFYPLFQLKYAIVSFLISFCIFVNATWKNLLNNLSIHFLNSEKYLRSFFFNCIAFDVNIYLNRFVIPGQSNLAPTWFSLISWWLKLLELYSRKVGES
jgi:hypothetical protein